MKNGWLIVNGFLKSEKFEEIYGFFLQNAAKYDINLLMIRSDELEYIPDELPQFAIFWDKDICLAKRLESRGLRLFNSASAVEICDSKILTALALEGKVPMPQTLFSPKTFPQVGYTNLNFLKTAEEILGMPMIIKEAYGSFGQQVYLAENSDKAKEIVKSLEGKDFVMQKFIAESRGRDIRLNVVGGKVVNAILRHSETDFRSNLTLGGESEIYFPTKEEKRIAEKACHIVGLDFAGVDVLFGKDGPLLCELNSNPHFKTTLQTTGVDLSENILRHISDQLA